MRINSDTITAPATPPGRGGVGVIRVSGSLVTTIAQGILGKVPGARQAHFCKFFAVDNSIIDQGLALYFRAPNSFTGEDVLELHCHGGPVVMDLLLQRILSLGARIANPGEFMECAFLNHKIDLAQAEATADLIDATSAQAAQNAIHSLQGEFSRQINILLAKLVQLRIYLEATIDFPEDSDIEEIAIERFANDIETIMKQIDQLQQTAKQGIILRDGVTVVITGEPNAGKSSLFNYLTGRDTAIVTAIPGTTRDILHARIHIEGLPINLLDTAGLHDTPDIIENEGIRRALTEIQNANHVLLMVDVTTKPKHDPNKLCTEFFGDKLDKARLTVLYNKIDLLNESAKIITTQGIDCIYMAVKTQQGLDLLRQHLKKTAGFAPVDSGFSARRRHLEALDQAERHLFNAKQNLLVTALELTAEDLTQAQRSLGEITGEFTTDDLLAKIFSEFCFGK